MVWKKIVSFFCVCNDVLFWGSTLPLLDTHKKKSFHFINSSSFSLSLYNHSHPVK